MAALTTIGQLALLGLVTLSPARHDSAQTRDPAAAPRFPARLEHFIDNVIRPTAAERKRLLEGAPITKFLDADPSVEVALFGAIWINADPHRYVQAVQDIEQFESGDAFINTKRISAPPRIEDFSALKLTPDDFKDLRTCRVGKCELKLDQAAIDQIRRDVDWNKPTAKGSTEQILRRLMYEYVKGYREKGNRGLAVYRDKDRPTFVADEFRSMIERMPELATYLPELRARLLEYPDVSLRQSTDFLYWQETKFGLKPTVRVNHLVIREGEDETIVASKMLYAAHYFWTGLELRILVPDPSRGPGFWFVNVNRGRADGLDGFTGSIVRGRVRSQSEESLSRSLIGTKKKLEGQP
jgi:hypothetical protein